MEVSVRELVSGQGHPRLLVVLVAVVALFAAVPLVVVVALTVAMVGHQVKLWEVSMCRRHQ